VKRLCFVVLAGLGASSQAQEAASPPPSADVEEIVVPGRTPRDLRHEIERLEASVYERFNALNSNDEFDIHCFEQAPTGSNIPLRTCAPNFVIRAEARSAGRLLNEGRGSATNSRDSVQNRSLMEEKSRQLTEEMQRIAREDEQLMRDLMRLDELRQPRSSD
jgi:hypothetical protein